MSMHFIFQNLIYLSCVLFPLFAQAAIESDAIYLGNGSPNDIQKIELDSIIKSIQPGTIVLLGELHQLGPHQDKQVEFINRLQAAGHRVSVGMEFLSYPFQHYVDSYIGGELSEKDFLQSVLWGKTDFNYYRRQILSSKNIGKSKTGRTLAINAPRSLTSKVGRKGLASLSVEEQDLLPPNFQQGNELYFERFWQVVGGSHIPREKAKNYFAAQSIWDDTMAWQSLKHLDENPDDILVIIVGDFHAIYGGGLPDRLRARGAKRVVTFSQINLANYANEEEVINEILPDKKWGPRADYIWTSFKETSN